MAATHKEDDEMISTTFPPFCEPTPEYYGICGVCNGYGIIPSIIVIGHYETCYNCGGDGKSVCIDGDNFGAIGGHSEYEFD